MAAPMKHMDTGEETVLFSLKSGASLVKSRPVFSPDSKCLFCCSGSVIKVFSTVSGECIRDLVGHDSLVTDILVNPHNRLQIVSCSVDKTIILWDYGDGILLRKIALSGCLYGVFPGKELQTLLCLKGKTHTDCNLVSQSLVSRPSDRSKSEVIFTDCSLDNRKTAVGCKEQYAVTVSGRKMSLASLAKDGRYQRHFLSKDDPGEFTCVACHPVDYVIATGCSSGKIYLWYNFFQEKRVVKTTSHWHALPVGDIKFTKEGSYMLSGGQESVLVKWSHDAVTKDFLPRLGAPINHVTCSDDNAYYAVSHDDNVVQVISNIFKIQQVYQGLTQGNVQCGQSGPCVPAGLLCDPRTGCLVTNGKPGHVQFYSVAEDKHLYNLDITGQNYVSPENCQQPLTVTQVTKANFSPSGDWLATVEHWDDGIMTPELRMKFWMYNEEKQSYMLNTTIETPHDAGVSSLLFRPLCSAISAEQESMAVTSSADGKFKLWTVVDDTDIYRANKRWNCESVGYYRDLPAGPTVFSEDGSLLAVAFDSTITLWEPDVNLLKQTLVNQTSRLSVTHLEFGCHSCGQYLVSCNDRQMTVWNLMSCTVHWTVDLAARVIVADPMSDIMAAVTSDRQLFVFRPSSPHPIFSQSHVSESDVIAAVFIPHNQKNSHLYGETTPLAWQNQSQFYFMNAKQELLTPIYKHSEKMQSDRTKVRLEQNLPQTALSLLMAQQRTSGVKPADSGDVVQQPKGAVKQLLSSASHVQPPVTSLCRSFIGSLLLPARNKRGHGRDEEEEEEEEESPWQQTGSVNSDSDMDVDEVDSDLKRKVKTQSVKSRTQSAKTETQSTETSSITTETEKQQADLSDAVLETVVSKSLDWYNPVS